LKNLVKCRSCDGIVVKCGIGADVKHFCRRDTLKLPAGHFGLGHGGGAHAPDEYFVIESANPKVQGIDGAIRSYVEYLYELGRQA
jgi:acetylornithine deacetylase/succinyl-diaminopimelate desuccinylase-like protein